ncbi:tautomerase family protein [Orrella sp. 11846]|uniref:tautomerase family protein n=1 Tax=Orrella sp. 11846 TaxID=3409913 RepID=UPI003B58FDC8
MPILNVSLLEGYAPHTRQALGQALTKAVQQVIDAHPDAIVVCFNEIGEHNYYRGGQSRRAGAARTAPADIVKDFLLAMQARDLQKANTYLASGFTMTFPGSEPMTTLAELVEFSKDRYRFVKKNFESFDTAWQDDLAIVYCHGTLYGEALDGSSFEGIRFMDRFEVRGSQLTKQQVWNDLALFLDSPKTK